MNSAPCWKDKTMTAKFPYNIAGKREVVLFEEWSAPRATAADIDRMWKRLWGEMTAPQIQSWYRVEDGEILDLTQIAASVLDGEKELK